jgi:hypothetical protein
MKIKYAGLITGICLLILSLNGTAAAGEEGRMMFKIPHEFTVGDQLLPAGRYSISTEAGDPAKLHIHNMAGETCAWLPVITRLAQHVHDESRVRMVFDRVGGQHMLSEVWLTGEDGYLVRGTPKDHSHEIVYFES